MGEIKKSEKITATDINTLKSKVIEIYQNRPFLVSGAELTDISSSGFGNTTITPNNLIDSNFYYILNALLQLNDIQNITTINTKYDIIFNGGASANEDLFTIVNTWKDLAHSSATKPISCRAGCVGLCWNNCSAACTKECTASNSGNGSYGNPAASGPHGQCIDNTCSSTCTGHCKEQCYELCTNYCKGCDGSCNDECYGSCTHGGKQD